MMFSPAPPLSPPSCRRRRLRGFTLIELLMVIAVLAILVAITFGVSRGVQNAQATAKARGELAVLSQALEQYKTTHGDYPWTRSGVSNPESNSETLLMSLLGWMKFENVEGETNFVQVSGGNASGQGPKSFLDASKFLIRKVGSDEESVELPDSALSPPVGYYLADPWGNPYVYAYGKKSGASNTWAVFGHHLYSMGSDGEQVDSAISSITGVMDKDFKEAGDGANLDNIYAGE